MNRGCTVYPGLVPGLRSAPVSMATLKSAYLQTSFDIMSKIFYPLLLLVITFIACNRNPYQSTNKAHKRQAKTLAKQIRQTPQKGTVATAPQWVGTTNFNLRKPNIVVIHHTAQNSCSQTLKTFTLPRTSVSAHYVLCKDGTVHHMLNDYLRAWHAGTGRWGNINDVNSSSIGIEIDNNGFEPFTDAQITALLAVLDSLKSRYGIPVANFVGHADIAPTRKNDPNVNFPWKMLADKGFGYWYADTTGVQVPPGFDAWAALRIVGYDVRDTAAVTTTFRRKYLGIENKEVLTESEKKILFTLYRRYMQ